MMFIRKKHFQNIFSNKMLKIIKYLSYNKNKS